MAVEHAPETVWRAEELYCIERGSFAAISEELQVSQSTLRRWAEKYGWRGKREELARAVVGIRVDTIRSRADVLRRLLEAEDNKEAAQLSSAAYRLERLAFSMEESLRRRAGSPKTQTEAAESPPPKLEAVPRDDAERIALLEEALDRQLAYILERPVADFAARIRDIKAAMDVLRSVRGGGGGGGELRVSFMESDDALETAMPDSSAGCG
ncbi:hypothetical protein LJC23_04320 [Desulfovibrio sp. OttesenSCG-928-I05]|nr:hypothetical protein [Desulfovibrio sp. OttesenSCG-928-I05]